MRPSSKELIERISDALTEMVLPAVGDDKWAASVVRSSTTLLNHLAARIEREAPFLLADNADVETVLRDVAPRLEALGLAESREVQSYLSDTVKRADYDTSALYARNRAAQALVDTLLRGVHERARTETQASDCQRALRDYLARRRERERDMYFPSFIGPPF